MVKGSPIANWHSCFERLMRFIFEEKHVFMTRLFSKLFFLYRAFRNFSFLHPTQKAQQMLR